MSADAPLTLLKDHQIVRVYLPLCSGGFLCLEGAVSAASASFVEIVFPPGSFDPEALLWQEEGLIVWERGENILSVRARLDRGTAGVGLRFAFTGVVFQPSGRRFPRVDAELYLKAWAAGRPAAGEGAPMRQRVNLSGCGLRFASQEAYVPGAQVALELCLPGPTLETVRCSGSVVRCRPLEPGRYEIALDLVQVPDPELTKIINFCLIEQFRQLHARVRSMGPVLTPSLERLAGGGSEEPA